MPTVPAKAKKLIKSGEAYVVGYKPFTIRLTRPSGGNRQEIKLGVDTGYQYVGLSAVTGKKEVIAIEAEIRTDIPKKLLEKAMYRRNRRNRNTRYRPARFNNRVNAREK